MKLKDSWKNKTEKNKYLAELIESDKMTPKDYNMKENHEVGDFITHPKFGLGFIDKIVDKKKISVFFEQSEKILLQNWT